MILKTSILFLLVSVPLIGVSQTAVENTSNGVQLNVKKSSGIEYSPQISSPSSYQIILNTENVVLTQEQLLLMNKYRRFDEDVEWKIKPGLTVLLYRFEQ